jgi:hypothetical protein
MPVHDWTRVDAGIFHPFHNAWISEIQLALNNGRLPSNYYALGEQRSGDFGPDVLTLEIEEENDLGDLPPAEWSPEGDTNGGTLTLTESRPKTRFAMECERDAAFYVARQRSIRVRHVSDDRFIAIIEIVSSGNKRNELALIAFMEKAMTALREGVHLLVIDLSPPRSFDPQGMHGVIWHYIEGDEGERYEPPENEPLTMASYVAANPILSFVEPLAVGRVLPEMPLFLTKERYINVPLEETYTAAYRGVPRRFKQLLEAAS